MPKTAFVAVTTLINADDMNIKVVNNLNKMKL